ncbi:MAG TPA: LCP family protein [Candidatus Pullilachnospira intestinigallinarum]|nr:LCP family protein [Candidatus Pullilachnospira intestinigallinarum]
MKKGKMSKKKKVLLIVLAIVLVVIIGAVAAVYAITHSLYRSSNYTADSDAMKGYTNTEEEVDEISPEESQGEAISDEEQQQLEAQMKEFSEAEPVTNDGDVYNVLLVGVDRRDTSWAGNSDTMILMSLNYEKKQISMISLMRDTYVDIPGIGMRKLNAAHANGAGPLLLETVTQNYKIQVDRYVSVDFNSLIDIIDKIGGVELTLSSEEVRVANNYIKEMCGLRDLDPTSYFFIQEGTKNCSGIQAVAYARIRYVGNADYERTERQRTVLTKIMEKLKDMSVTQLYGFAQDVLPLVTHNIPESEMWNLLAKAPELFQYTLVKDRIPYDGMFRVIYVNRQDMLVPDWEETIAKLKETLY